MISLMKIRLPCYRVSIPKLKCLERSQSHNLEPEAKIYFITKVRRRRLIDWGALDMSCRRRTWAGYLETGRMHSLKRGKSSCQIKESQSRITPDEKQIPRERAARTDAEACMSNRER